MTKEVIPLEEALNLFLRSDILNTDVNMNTTKQTSPTADAGVISRQGQLTNYLVIKVRTINKTDERSSVHQSCLYPCVFFLLTKKYLFNLKKYKNLKGRIIDEFEMIILSEIVNNYQRKILLQI